MDERFAQQFLHGRKNRSTPRIPQHGLRRMIAFPSCLSLTNINSTRCRFSVLAVAKSVSRSHLQRACSARSQRRDERVSSRDLRVRFARGAARRTKTGVAYKLCIVSSMFLSCRQRRVERELLSKSVVIPAHTQLGLCATAELCRCNDSCHEKSILRHARRCQSCRFFDLERDCAHARALALP